MSTDEKIAVSWETQFRYRMRFKNAADLINTFGLEERRPEGHAWTTEDAIAAFHEAVDERHWSIADTLLNYSDDSSWVDGEVEEFSVEAKAVPAESVTP